MHPEIKFHRYLVVGTASIVGCPQAPFSVRRRFDGSDIGIQSKSFHMRRCFQPGVLNPLLISDELMAPCFSFCCCSADVLSDITSENNELVTRDFTDGYSRKLRLQTFSELSRCTKLNSRVSPILVVSEVLETPNSETTVEPRVGNLAMATAPAQNLLRQSIMRVRV